MNARLESHLFAFLAWDAAGLVIAAVPVAIGVACAVASEELPLRLIALVLVAIGIALAIGATRHLVALGRLRATHPPPGHFVEVDGHRMHLLAEGPAQGPAIVWLPGGHVGGHALHHLHAALSRDTRSILIDRFGTGWSDVGPFPRTTARESDEVMMALEVAGEAGPFVFAGHSFGGLLAANVARRFPERTHALVLLDPTPLDVIAYGPRLGALRAMRDDAWASGLMTLFGFDAGHRHDRRARENAAYADVLDSVERALGDAGRALRAVERSRAGTWFAGASIYRELTPHGLAERAWETVVFDGDLGALPVYLVAPKDSAEVADLPEARVARSPDRMVAFFAACRERYLATSSKSVRIVAPKDSGHNFPYVVPDVVAEALRQAVRSAPDETSRAAHQHLPASGVRDAA